MTALVCIQRAAFISLMAASLFARASADSGAGEISIDAGGITDREVRVTNGEITQKQQYPFLTAVMTSRQATVAIDSVAHEAFFFGASEPMEFGGAVVDCGLSLTPCTAAANKICSIVFDFPDDTGAVRSPAQQLDSCRIGGGLGAIFRAGPQQPVSLSVDASQSLIPAVYLVTRDGQQAVRNSLASGSEFPVQVTPQLPQKILCGGTYLGADWVLTAAHCVVDGNATPPRMVEPYELLVNVAAFDLAAEKPFIQRVTQVITNNYHTNGPWGVNDYALLRLESMPTRGLAIDLLRQDELESLAAASAPAVVLGWGSTAVREPLTPIDPNLITSNFPLQATLNLHTLVDCQILWRDFFRRNSLDSLGLVIDQNHVCASNVQYQQDTCQGDSGGPLLVHNNEGVLKLAGITNFGLGCGSSQSTPGVYASVPSFSSWITRTTGLPTQEGSDRLNSNQNDFSQSLTTSGGTGSWSPGGLFILLSLSAGVRYLSR